MKSYFYYIDYEEFYERAYEFIFSLCDKVEYLYERPWENRKLENDLIGHEYEDILPFIIKKEFSKAWGMAGMVYTFSLAEPVKKMIKENGLDIMIYVPQAKKYMENLTLYKEEEQIYSVCSHEGYKEMSDSFGKSISAFCYKEMQNTELFSKLQKKQKELLKQSPIWTKEKMSKALDRLSELSNQVEQACDFYIYVTPRYKTTFKTYKKLAKNFLTESINEVLDTANDYSDLYPEEMLTSKDEKNINRKSIHAVQAKLCADLFWQISIWQDFLL